MDVPATVPLVHLGGWLTISFYILNYIFMFVAATDVGLNIVCVSGCVLGEGHRGSMDKELLSLLGTVLHFQQRQTKSDGFERIHCGFC